MRAVRQARRALIATAIAFLLALIWLLAHVPVWFWHPLIGRGYQFWSGIASDVSELTFPIEVLTAAVAIHQFLHSHFECHEQTCHRLGFHHVPGTPYRTCWHCHPVLQEHDKHGVPLGTIHKRHAEAN